MSIENNKLMNLADGKVLYDDLRGRIPVIDDTAGTGATTKVVSADKHATDHSALLNAINVLDNSKAPIIIDSASGAIATFPDGADSLPVESLIVNIEPVQDLHGQSNPYPAGGGKNKANVEDVTGITTQTQIGTVTLPAGDYCLSAYISNSGSASVAVRITDANNTTIKNTTYVTSAETRVYGTFTLAAETACKIVVVGSAAGYNGTVKKVQIESGSSMTDFAPYSNICPITGWTGCNVKRLGINIFDGAMENGDISQSTGQNNGTSSSRYRSVNYIPIRNGSYYFNSPGRTRTVRIFAYDINKNFLWFDTWNVNAVNNFVPSVARYIRFRFSSAAVAGDTEISINVPSGNIGYYPYAGQTYPITFGSAGTVYGGTLNPVTGELVVTHGQIASYAGETLPGAWISDRDVYAAGTTPTTGAQVVYELATPVEYDLSDLPTIRTLLGANNIWADTGDVSVDYRADTKLYIQQLTKPTEDDMTANTAITSGKFFMVNNRLFLATAAIAVGATIIPGTNCTELSLADALNNINA